jgi:hypothetical protein
LPRPTGGVSLLGVQLEAVLLAVIKIRFKRLFVNDMSTSCNIVGSHNNYYANQSESARAARVRKGKGLLLSESVSERQLYASRAREKRLEVI